MSQHLSKEDTDAEIVCRAGSPRSAGSGRRIRGLDLDVLQRELGAACADDPTLIGSLRHGLARLRHMGSSPTTVPTPTVAPPTSADPDEPPSRITTVILFDRLERNVDPLVG